MTDLDERVLHIVHEAIDRLNEERSDKPPLAKDPDTPLFGRDSTLDSLDLVNLIVAIEELVEERFDVLITLANEKALSAKSSPFRTVATVSAYAGSLVREHTDG
ncbi:MAG: hypothetical protein Kow0092_04970 [Deferrisomatales bacterium]